MKKEKECIGYREGKKICKFGFIQHQISICGGYVTGNEKADTPNCCKEIEPFDWKD
jgi:hypothetical protein